MSNRPRFILFGGIRLFTYINILQSLLIILVQLTYNWIFVPRTENKWLIIFKQNLFFDGPYWRGRTLLCDIDQTQVFYLSPNKWPNVCIGLKPMPPENVTITFHQTCPSNMYQHTNSSSNELYLSMHFLPHCASTRVTNILISTAACNMSRALWSQKSMSILLNDGVIFLLVLTCL